MECVLNLGEWKSVLSNKPNIRILAEYQLQKDIVNTNIPPIISDYFIDELALKSWIFNKYSIQDYLLAIEYVNSYNVNEEDFITEIPHIEKKFKEVSRQKINVGYIIDKIDDYYTLYYLLLMRFKDPLVNSYIIVYESSEFIANFKSNDFIIIFNTMQHPYHKSEQLKKYDFDVIFFLESMCTEIYDNLTIRKINQLLSYKPATIIISSPYNGITKSEKIFDYVILDENIFTDENRLLYQEKVIVCKNTDYTVKPEIFWINLKTKDFTNVYKLNNMKEEELQIEIENYNFPEEIFFGNLSETYKITEILFITWLTILKQNENSKLIMKSSNNLQVENFKISAENFGISAERLIFVNANNREEIIDAMKIIDIYLDIIYINGEDKLQIALFLNIACVCFAKPNDSENVLSNFCLRYLQNSNIDMYANSYDDYKKIAFDHFLDLTSNILNIGYTRLKKLELTKNLEVIFF